MTPNLTEIILDMGELPVNDKEEVDFFDMPDMFPGQFMVTKKGHKRMLEVTLYRDKTNSNILFEIKSDFAYFKPIVSNGKIDDHLTNIRNFLDSDNIIAGRLENKDSKSIKFIQSGVGVPIEFYSLDSEMNLHTSQISLKYKPAKNLLELTLIYDNKLKAEFDTNANYSLKDISKKGLLKSKEIKSGNLLSEEDNTLYIDKSIPIKLYAKSPKE